MIGFILAFVKNMFFLGFAIIEALVFMLAWNYIAPDIVIMFPEIPTSIQLFIVDIFYWKVYAIIVIIHFLGRWIKSLSPFIAKQSVNNSSTTNIEREKKLW